MQLDEEQIKEYIKQAAASFKIDGLPLSDEYINELLKKKIKMIKEGNPKVLIYKRGDNHE